MNSEVEGNNGQVNSTNNVVSNSISNQSAVNNIINNQVSVTQGQAQPMTSEVQAQAVTSEVQTQAVTFEVQTQPVTSDSTSLQTNNPLSNDSKEMTTSNIIENNEFSSLELNAEDLLINNTEGKIDSNNQVVVPTESKVLVTELNTSSKKTSNAIIFVLIVILALVIYFMNDIFDFYENKISPLFNNSENNSNTTNNDDNGFNLVDGFIKVGEPNSYIKLKGIKFYNFRESDSGKYISFNYLSSLKYNDIKDEEIYVELYNSNKEIIYKELFSSDDKIEKDSVSTYKINITDDVFYALVKVYSESEIKSTSSLVCVYKINNEFINLEYKNTYEFINNSLIKYSVSKGYEKLKDNAIILSAQEEIKSEYTNIIKYNISNKYNDNSLEYSVDLSNYPSEFNPLYEKDTIITIIKNKEELKGWECK